MAVLGGWEDFTRNGRKPGMGGGGVGFVKGEWGFIMGGVGEGGG